VLLAADLVCPFSMPPQHHAAAQHAQPSASPSPLPSNGGEDVLVFDDAASAPAPGVQAPDPACARAASQCLLPDGKRCYSYIDPSCSGAASHDRTGCNAGDIPNCRYCIFGAAHTAQGALTSIFVGCPATVLRAMPPPSLSVAGSPPPATLMSAQAPPPSPEPLLLGKQAAAIPNTQETSSDSGFWWLFLVLVGCALVALAVRFSQHRAKTSDVRFSISADATMRNTRPMRAFAEDRENLTTSDEE